MTVILISVLTIVALSIGFAFGRGYQIEREVERRTKSHTGVLDLHPSEWERVA